MSQQPQDLLEFDAYCIDVRQRVLLSSGVPVPLAPKVFDTLLALAEEPNRVLEKDHLLSKIWRDTFVEEGSLARNVSTLRKVLGPSPDGTDYIETVPTRGYRFKAAVRRREEQELGPGAPDEATRFVSSPNLDATRAHVVGVGGAAPPPRRQFRLAWAAGLVLVGASAIAAWAYLRPMPRPSAITSIAVLPFLNLTGDKDQEYFSDGLTEEVINALAHVPGLHVVSRTTVFQFKNHAGDIRELGRRLNADAVMEGSVRRDGGRLRVTVQLNSVSDGYHYWSRTWDSDGPGVLAIQQGIATQVAGSLRPSDAGVVITGRPITTDPEAYTLYLQGQFHGRRGSGPSTETAANFYRNAIAKDPSFAQAYVGLAILLNGAGTSGLMQPADAFPQARDALNKGLELDPMLATGYTAKGLMALHYDWDWRAAEDNLRRSIALDPDDAETHHAWSHYMLVTRRFPESLAATRRAIAIDPLNAGLLNHLALHYLLAHDFASAIEAMKSALDIDPAALQVLDRGTEAYEAGGRLEEAVDLRAQQRQPKELLDALRTRLAAEGPRGYWTAMRDYQRPRGGHNPSLLMAYVRLGQHEDALDLFERAVSERRGGVVYANVSPIYDGVRAHPRYKALVARIGLPPAPDGAPVDQRFAWQVP